MDTIALIKAERDKVARQLNGPECSTRSFRGDVQDRIIQTTPENVSSSEWLERLYLLLDTRPLRLSDRCAANQRHDEMYAHNPWFRLWKRYGV